MVRVRNFEVMSSDKYNTEYIVKWWPFFYKNKRILEKVKIMTAVCKVRHSDSSGIRSYEELHCISMLDFLVTYIVKI